MKTGSELIAEERQRQVEEEGWSSAHDDGYFGFELPRAAACYAMGEPIFLERRLGVGGDRRLPIVTFPNVWPWDKEEWKPKDDLSNLVRAGALIAAEIDRIQRRTKREEEGASP